MKNIIFAGTPEISANILDSLVKSKFPIIACLTQPDRPKGRGRKITASPVKQTALKHNIPILQPDNLKNLQIQSQIADLNPDAIIVMAYGLIFPEEILNIPKYGCINIHASILPRWRGAAPIQHSILANDQQTGITIMKMDNGLDTGDIIATYPIDIEEKITAGLLLQKLDKLGQEAIVDILPKISAHKIKPAAQKNELATYAPKLNKTDAKINWDESAEYIERLIRAYNPWPVAFTNLGEETVKILESEVIKNHPAYIKEPGQIVKIDDQGIQVITGHGVLQIQRLQFPGKKPVSAKEACKSKKLLKPETKFC